VGGVRTVTSKVIESSSSNLTGGNEREFLEHTCEKAGLAKDYWKKAEVEIQKFEGIVFKEKDPNGEVIQKKLLD